MNPPIYPAPNQQLQPLLQTTDQIAALLQVNRRTIQNWRDSGRIPFLRITARSFRYDIDQVMRALAKN